MQHSITIHPEMSRHTQNIIKQKELTSGEEGSFTLASAEAHGRLHSTDRRLAADAKQVCNLIDLSSFHQCESRCSEPKLCCVRPVTLLTVIDE